MIGGVAISRLSLQSETLNQNESGLCLRLILRAQVEILTPSYFPSITDSVSCTLELQRHKDAVFSTPSVF